jgi:hypothetical protein
MKRPLTREIRYPNTRVGPPEDRYYYGWYDPMPQLEPSDSGISRNWSISFERTLIRRTMSSESTSSTGLRC